MNPQLAAKLDTLKTDYESVVGHPFKYFYCPILGTDEDTVLCQGHVINQKIPGADRSWTVQRADVDNRFGSLFESDFQAVEHAKLSPIAEALSNNDTARIFRPKLFFDSTPIDHYISPAPLPPEHTAVALEVNGATVPIRFKIPSEDILGALDGTWEFRVDKDFRLAYVVSILKAAHLTMFHLQGYRYALSYTGFFLGQTILGEFLRKIVGLDRTETMEMAKEHFTPFAPMVRPVIALPWDFSGTVTDRNVLAWMFGNRPWANAVLVRPGARMHAVVVPLLEDDDWTDTFLDFLEFPSRDVEMRVGRIGTDQIDVFRDSVTTRWPEAPFRDSGTVTDTSPEMRQDQQMSPKVERDYRCPFVPLNKPHRSSPTHGSCIGSKLWPVQSLTPGCKRSIDG